MASISIGDERLPRRFWIKVRSDDNGCWIWTGCRRPNGYAQFYASPLLRSAHAHRVAYSILVGVIPENMEIDHLCRTRACVNPNHMEVVSHRENDLRGMAPNIVTWRTGRCQRGHAFSGRNAYVRPDGRGRQCRQCNIDKRRELRELQVRGGPLFVGSREGDRK